MEELKLHSEGAAQHLKAIDEAFATFQKNLNTRTDLTSTEKEAQLSKAKASFLAQKKQWRDLLF